MADTYAAKYGQDGYYWGTAPSATCYEVLKRMPPDRPRKLLDIGCGEGRNAVFFARNGYDVTAFDLSAKGVEKTKTLAEALSVPLRVFQADLQTFRLQEPFDVLFATGVLHYLPAESRESLFEHYKQSTAPGGLNVFSVFVRKPFIEKSPDADSTAHWFVSGEILTYYHDWQIEYCIEEIIDCNSGGVPHRHAVNRIVARKPEE